MPRQRRSRCFSFALARLALLAWSAAAHAYRPFDGTDADVVSAALIKGILREGSLHLNAAFARNRDGDDEIFGSAILAMWESRDTLSFDLALRAIRAAGTWSYEGRIGLTWLFAVDRG